MASTLKIKGAVGCRAPAKGVALGSRSVARAPLRPCRIGPRHGCIVKAVKDEVGIAALGHNVPCRHESLCLKRVCNTKCAQEEEQEQLTGKSIDASGAGSSWASPGWCVCVAAIDIRCNMARVRSPQPLPGFRCHSIDCAHAGSLS